MGVTGIGQGNYQAYYDTLKAYREQQFHKGDMVGYQETTQTCEEWNRTAGKQKDISEYLDMPQGKVNIQQKEVNLQSGILGLSVLGNEEQMYTITASYAEDSTVQNPMIEVTASLLDNKGAVQEIKVKVAVTQVDVTGATQLEMFALCCHGDKQGLTGFSKTGDSYQKLLRETIEGSNCESAENLMDFIGKKQDWSSLEPKMEQRINSLLEDRIEAAGGVPYNHLAKDGFIDYNGVVFVCDEEHNAICLGNVADKSQCLIIPLEEGGTLIVNRDNLGDLAKAISMFSPEDVNRIMRAIAQDAKVQQMKKELDDEEDTIGMAESTQEESGAVQMAEKESDENKIDEK